MARVTSGARRRRGRALRAAILVFVLAALGLFVWTERGEVATVMARVFPSWAESYRMARVEQHAEAIRVAAAESGVEAELLAGVMAAESSGRPGARSHKGALGLFQLAPATAAERARKLGIPEPTEEELLGDPVLNARLGANYFAYLLQRFDENEEAALVAYNRGPTVLRSWIRKAGSFQAWKDERVAAGGSELLDYASKVLRYRELFRHRPAFAPRAPESAPAELPLPPTGKG